jgi:cytidylate kinase
MAKVQPTISEMHAVTISREYGSGGGEIAARLAQRLGWQLIDREVVAQVASELHIPEGEVEQLDEHVLGSISRILSTMRTSETVLTTPTPTPAETERAYYEALRHILVAAANMGHVVIVGRGGQMILAGRRDVLRVRVVAPLAQRVARIMHREGLDEDAARARIQMKDHDRERFMLTLFHRQHTDPHLYDLVINTDALDLDSAADVISLMLERKASRLTVPVEEPGSDAGMGH